MMTNMEDEGPFDTWCKSCGNRGTAMASELDGSNGRACERCGKPRLNGRDNPGSFDQPSSVLEDDEFP